MKSKLPLFLLLVIVFASGCLGEKATTPIPVPSGYFSGQFRKIHKSATTGKIDTLSCNLLLYLNTATGFSVGGDTSTVHAGSYGGYAITSSYIQFNDVTYSKTSTSTKTHLEGIYEYYYDGSTFQMLGTPVSDTLAYQYDLKKSTN